MNRGGFDRRVVVEQRRRENADGGQDSMLNDVADSDAPMGVLVRVQPRRGLPYFSTDLVGVLDVDSPVMLAVADWAARRSCLIRALSTG